MKDGILVIDKPQEMTSFLCCAILRRLLGTKKIGHTGTLDPNATGVLPILVGRATKLLDRLPNHDKRYTAVVQFGMISDTYDIWGNTEKTNLSFPKIDAIEQALCSFRGEIMQIPPMTSAIKKDGVRLYQLARQGIAVEREPRPVIVYEINLLSYDDATGQAVLDCTCSKGTYIRSICHDLGQMLQCGAVMSSLRRTVAAGYTLDDCITVDKAKSLAENGTLSEYILPMDSVLTDYPAVTVTEAQAIRFHNGGALALQRLHEPIVGRTRVYSPDGILLGLGVPKNDELTIDCIL